MTELRQMIRKELLEQWRTKKILIMAILFLFVALSSPIIAKLTPEIVKTVSIPGMTINLPEPTFKDALDQFIKNISQLALLGLVFVVAGAVSDEKNKKTLEIVLTKPLSRSAFIVSKFVGYLVSITAIFGAAAVLFYLYTVTIFTAFSFAHFTAMAVTVLLYMLMIASITICASTLVNSPIIAGGIGFVSFILFGTVSSLIEGVQQFSPNMILTKYQEVIAHGWMNSLALPVGVIVAVIGLSILISVIAFRSQEIER